MDNGQVWPVQYVDHPVCGAGGHHHPLTSSSSCLIEFAEYAPALNDQASRRRTALGHGFIQEIAQRPLEDRSAFHRAMCEPRYTHPADIDKAFEIEAGAKVRAVQIRKDHPDIPG